jgi:hypothetical protein
MNVLEPRVNNLVSAIQNGNHEEKSLGSKHKGDAYPLNPIFMVLWFT